MLTTRSGAAVVGRLGLGVCSDRYNAWLLALLTLFVFWGVLAHNIGGLIAFGLAYGFVGGGWSSLSSGFVR
jgi:MCP family monocarboxylic acid transporter-like MFS transporter 10